MKPRKIKISQEVKDKRANYEPESRSESFHLGRVTNAEMTKLSDAHGRVTMAIPKLGELATARDYQGAEDARRHETSVKKSMKPTYSGTGKGKLQSGARAGSN